MPASIKMFASCRCLALALGWFALAVRADLIEPYAQQVAEQIQRLHATAPGVRSSAAAALGFLRASGAADALVSALHDDVASVRRDAALALAWCGGRSHVAPLLAALTDEEWSVRQSAAVALENLTGASPRYDALQPDAAAWRAWWAGVASNQPPRDALAAVAITPLPTDWAAGCSVTASSIYKGPASALTDGDAATFWQTKLVPFPQSCTVDLGTSRPVGCVMVDQYAPGYCMTAASVLVGDDEQHLAEVWRAETTTPVRLVAKFTPRPTRFVRIVSRGNQRPTFPTTFRSLGVFAHDASLDSAHAQAVTRSLRALGALGGEGAEAAVRNALMPFLHAAVATPAENTIVQAGLHALGRLRAPASLPVLISFLDQPRWARFAAEALGDFGGEPAAHALAVRYPLYARGLNGEEPQRVPEDDRPGFESLDRMYETPFQIAAALSRLPVTQADLVSLAPLLMANLPSDFDGAVLYEPEAVQAITVHLLEKAGLRDAARDTALAACGVPVAVASHPAFAAQARRFHGDVPFAAQWLPMLGATPELLSHSNGWIRIGAAKALMFAHATNHADRIADILAASRTEAEYGFFGGFEFHRAVPQGQDEYNDPPPRWREAFARALGKLGGPHHVPLLVRLLNDERNALEIQYAAAQSLDDIGTPDALAALRTAESDHAFHSVRMVAREALWRRNVLSNATPAATTPPMRPRDAADSTPGGYVFIKGPARMPNRFQVDPWRQTYSTTDSGPTYRLGWNLFTLRDGVARPLTHFTNGWVADCEVSADGTRVLFARRGGDDDPWWHVWEIGADGSNPRPRTHGPYHDVQPNYLNDGRIVFSSSRIGYRDEYHGYPATGLTVMNADGSDLHCIGFNLGRDNEPALLPDGRIVFSRLDLFYSRLKTELTVQAAFPDGTRNTTLYGPERRAFWRQITQQSRENWWGEAPSRHRVLRSTQPQPFDGGRVLVATTGGLTLTGPGRQRETILPHDRKLAVTTPYPLGDGRILCAAVAKDLASEEGQLDLYEMDAATGAMTLLYHDPEAACFEARPMRARPVGPVLHDDPRSRGHAFTTRLICGSIRATQLPAVAERGRLLRVIEGMPVVGRHHTQNSPGTQAWKNHVGTTARVLATLPLAPDGSFDIEVPADRLIHLQVLDSDRRVVGNQLVWMYGRPGESRSCVGCHESPDASPSRSTQPAASLMPPQQALPLPGDFRYRAKVWQKGELSDLAEERTRTAGAINLFARP